MVEGNRPNVVDRPISWQANQPSGTVLVADQAGAEVAVVGVGVYGDALEETSVVLAQGNEALGMVVLCAKSGSCRI